MLVLSKITVARPQKRLAQHSLKIPLRILGLKTVILVYLAALIRGVSSSTSQWASLKSISLQKKNRFQDVSEPLGDRILKKWAEQFEQVPTSGNLSSQLESTLSLIHLTGYLSMSSYKAL